MQENIPKQQQNQPKLLKTQGYREEQQSTKKNSALTLGSASSSSRIPVGALTGRGISPLFA